MRFILRVNMFIVLIVIGDVRGMKLAIPLTAFVNDVLSHYVAEVLLVFS